MNNITNIQHSTFNIEHPMVYCRAGFLGCWAFDVEC